MEEENQVAASAEVSTSEPMSFDSALDILNQADQAPIEENTAATEAPEGEETVEEADPAEASNEEEEATSDAEPEAELVLHGNAKTRLRNGQEVTIGDLKKRWEEAEEYKAKHAEVEARAREFDQRQQAIAAQEQLFTQTINQAKAVLQANFPPKPNYEALQRGEIDIITYNEQKAAWDHAAEKWHALNRAEQAKAEQSKKEQAELEKQQAEELNQLRAREIELLKEAIPELKSEQGFKAFREDILTNAPKEYGFSAEEIAHWVDNRSLRVLKDALAYRKLQADKAKVAEKVKNVPPVQVSAPGRRVSPAEKQATTVNEALTAARARGGMSLEEAAALLNKMN